MSYYTYQYLRHNGTPYYVGKGSRKRAYEKHTVEVPERARITKQYWASEAEAFEMEKWWIRFWGRLDLGTGCLENKDAGGYPLGSPESHVKGGRIGGRVRSVRAIESKRRTGRNHVESGHLRSICADGGRVGGKVSGRNNVENGHLLSICVAGGYAYTAIPGHMAAIGRKGTRAATHTRWHVNRGIVREGCELCHAPA